MKNSLGVRSMWYRVLQVALLVVVLVSCEVIPEDDRYIPIDMEMTNRTTLLVEFSALKCVNCPDAAEEAHKLLEMYGDRLVVVEMHPATNSLTAAKPEWDYTCEESDVYYTYFGGSNTTPFPTGVVNMTKTDGSYFLAHSLWGAAYQESAGKISHIDIQHWVDYNEETGIVSFQADITNLSSAAMDIQYIVWLTEDSIIGPQLMPDGTLNQQYAHNHVLRDAITDVWGMPLAMDVYATQHLELSYTLPEKVNPAHCNIVSVVMKDGEVIQSKEYKMRK